MKEQLAPQEEALIERFHCHLADVKFVEDIFPPDIGVREPLTPPLPGRPGSESVCLAAVYDLCIARQRRAALKEKGRVILETIDDIVPA